MTSQRGSIKLSIVIATVFGLGLAASMYLNYSQATNAAQDHKLLQGQITDLRYQVNQDIAASAGPSPTPTPLATPDPSPTPTPTPVLGASTAKATIVKKSSVQPNFRSQPNGGSILVSHVAAGTPVTYVDSSLTAGYAHVTINGATGYILASYLQ